MMYIGERGLSKLEAFLCSACPSDYETENLLLSIQENGVFLCFFVCFFCLFVCLFVLFCFVYFVLFSFVLFLGRSGSPPSVYIRESVHSLCRDDADAQYMQYLSKSRITSPQTR